MPCHVVLVVLSGAVGCHLRYIYTLYQQTNCTIQLRLPPPLPPSDTIGSAITVCKEVDMGNCQAIDNASLVIQHPNGRAERLYTNISAAEVMKLNPGHYVALLLTTTLYSSRPPTSTSDSNKQTATTNSQPLRITRIKLLRATESLTVGHIYRLVTTQEVMKGLMAKKNGKTSSNIRVLKPSEESAGKNEDSATRSNQSERTRNHIQMKKSEKDRRRTVAPANSSAAAIKPRGWHPSLNSISEASS
ncbi:unnamed protein product [Lactuca saligna]|uniref:Uncharacterized protein n=1 Tax=Lactuca saligna TaxID=75948 RepID=A0AA35V9U8_LACSI|nr:unnamed protein product [Lactuca saligna]